MIFNFFRNQTLFFLLEVKTAKESGSQRSFATKEAGKQKSKVGEILSMMAGRYLCKISHAIMSFYGVQAFWCIDSGEETHFKSSLRTNVGFEGIKW